MKKLVSTRIFFFIYVSFILRCLFVECSQHIMKLPDDILTYIGRLVFTQSAPTIIFDPIETNKDQHVLADVHSVYTILNNSNNDFHAFKNTNKRLCFLLNFIIKSYRDDIMIKAKNTVVSANSFFTYYYNNSIQITGKNNILLTRFYSCYQVPFKFNWFQKLCGWKPTFQETVQGSCVLHQLPKKKVLYLKIDFKLQNNTGPSFIQMMLQRTCGTSWRIALLIQLLNDKGGMLETLYPYMEFAKMFKFTSLDLDDESYYEFYNSSSYLSHFKTRQKRVTADRTEIEKQYILSQKYSIPISSIPLDVFLDCIANKGSM